MVPKVGSVTGDFSFEKQIVLKIRFRVAKEHFNSAYIGFRLLDQQERVIFSSEKPAKNFISQNGISDVLIKLPKSTLVPNNYRVIIGYHVPNQEIISLLENSVSFKIEETGSLMQKYHGSNYGCVVLPCEWN